MFVKMDIFIKHVLNKYFLIILGCFLAFFSSKALLEFGLPRNFWDNDEGQFFVCAHMMFSKEAFYPQNCIIEQNLIIKLKQMENISIGVLIDYFRTFLSYKLFITIINPYFLFLKSPFLIVFIHKIILNTFFIFYFQKSLIQNSGYKIYLILLCCFCYLNLFFLRETLFFLIGLSILIRLPITNFTSQLTHLGLLFGLFFIRPQAIFLYIKVKYAILFISCLILIYLVKDFNLDNRSFLDTFDSFLAIFVTKNLIGTFTSLQNMLDYFYEIILSFNSLNPFSKFNFFVNQKLYLNYFFLFVSSLSLFLFAGQIILGLFSKNLYIELWKNIVFGVFILVVIYSHFKVPIDARVFISALSPFFIFFNHKFLNFKVITLTIFILLTLESIKNYF